MVSDEELMAYMDGELEPADRARIEAAAARDAQLAKRLEQAQRMHALMGQAFPLPPTQEAPSPGLAAAIDKLAANPPAPSQKITAFPGRRPTPRPAIARNWALAASVVFAVAGGMFFWNSAREDAAHLVVENDAGIIAPNNPLFAALESTPSATTYDTNSAGDSVRPILSFAANDGRFCREFEVRSGEATSVGLACRGDGEWRLEVLLPAGGEGFGASGGYAPASGYNEKALAAVVDSLMQSEPLDAEAERALIERRWQRPTE
jgi:hypothetical protein